MKIIKFIASFLLFLGILVLMVWAIIKSKDQTCSQISILINSPGETQLLLESDILHILRENNMEWKKKAIKDFDLTNVNKILAKENYIESVDKVHFLGTKLQIEITLYNILLEVQPQNREKFLLDVKGTYLPYSPKIENSVIVAEGNIPYSFQKKETVPSTDQELYELYSMALLISADSFYKKLFCKLYINEKGEITLYPSIGKLPVLFGSMQGAQNKLKSLKYMYKDVLPYMNENQYAQLDVRFKNRIIATKSKT